jgi:hypothetical protein
MALGGGGGGDDGIGETRMKRGGKGQRETGKRRGLCDRLPSAVVARVFGYLAPLAHAHVAQTCAAARRISRLPGASPALVKLLGRQGTIHSHHLPSPGAVNPRRLVVADAFSDSGEPLTYGHEFGSVKLWQAVARMPALVELDLRCLGWRSPRPRPPPIGFGALGGQRAGRIRCADAAAVEVCDCFSALGPLLPSLTALHVDRLPVAAAVSLSGFTHLLEFSASALTCGQLEQLPSASLTALSVRSGLVEERANNTHVAPDVALAALLAFVVRAPRLSALHLPTTGVAGALCEALAARFTDQPLGCGDGDGDGDVRGRALARLQRLEMGASAFEQATSGISAALDVPHVTAHDVSIERVVQVLERESKRLARLELYVDSGATLGDLKVRREPHAFMFAYAVTALASSPTGEQSIHAGEQSIHTGEQSSPTGEAALRSPSFPIPRVQSRPALRELSLHARRDMCAYLLTQIVPGAPALATVRLAIRHWPYRAAPPPALVDVSGGTAAEFASLAAAPRLETLEITLERGDSSRVYVGDWISPAASLAALTRLALVSKSPSIVWDATDLGAARATPRLRTVGIGGWVVGLRGAGDRVPRLAEIDVQVHDPRTLVDARTLADLLPELDTFSRLERLTLPTGLRECLGIRDLEAIAAASDRLRARGIATEYV